MNKEIKVGDYVRNKASKTVYRVKEVRRDEVVLSMDIGYSSSSVLFYVNDKSFTNGFEVMDVENSFDKKKVEDSFKDLRLKLSDLAHRFPNVKEYKDLLVEYNKAIAKLDQ